MSSVKFNQKNISKSEKPYFIADIGANHDNDLNRAFMLIELAKKAGADAAKFQNFSAEKIVNGNVFNKKKKLSHQANWVKSVYEVYQDASLNLDWTKSLYDKCQEVGIEYLTTPYDFDSLDYVDEYLNFYKIGSGDISWIDFIENIAQRNKPVIISSGASSLEDVKRAVRTIQKYHDQIVLLQCNTNYTAEENNYDFINLNVLNLYNRLFPEIELGLSDHTFGSETALGAITLGARVIEKHFTDDNSRVGPDHTFAMNPTTFREMVDSANKLFRALGDGIKRVEKNEEDSYLVQRRSLYLAKDVVEGQKLKYEHIIALRPVIENGYEAYDLDKILGASTKRNLKRGEPIMTGDIKI